MAPCSWNMLPWWYVCILTVMKWCVRLNDSCIYKPRYTSGWLTLRSGRIHCSICKGVDVSDSRFCVLVLRYIKMSFVTVACRVVACTLLDTCQCCRGTYCISLRDNMHTVRTSDLEISFIHLLLLHNNDLVCKITECNIAILFCTCLDFSAQKFYRNF